MLLPNFNYHRPQTLERAFEILNSSENAAPVAGGTDILVEIKQGVREANDIISLNDIRELKVIDEDENNIYIGPTVTHTMIERSPVIKKYIPALAEAVSKIGTPQVRNTGTIGGNLCTCASCADSAPILMAYDAVIEAGSSGNKRTINLPEFLIFHHRTALQKGELLTKIIVPKPKPNTGACFDKFGLRASASISVASVAVSLTAENGTVTAAHVIVGACAPTPIICPSAESLLMNADVNQITQGSELMKKIGDAASADINPINDIRGSAAYRQEIVSVLTQRVILKAVERINQ